MFIAALHTIAKIWKQPKCPLIDGWRKTTHTHTHTHTHTGILYSDKRMKLWHLRQPGETQRE